MYFKDLKESEDYRTTVKNAEVLRFQPDDLLNIRVSSLNRESDELFNQSSKQPAANVGLNGTQLDNGYLVDSAGYANFPVVGKVKLGGLTNEEATARMTAAVSNYVKSPLVSIRLLNFRITVIGEVNRPSTFQVPSGRINILEALGLAGDMTAYGRRENVLLVRERNHVRSTTRLNLNNKELLNSPYFYLQQNDVLYVAPDRLKEVQASTNTRTVTIVTIAASLVVALLFNFQNIFR
ncbi:MAG: polysaccharide biosynthesis/export family protein [Hymenobacter sp.]